MMPELTAQARIRDTTACLVFSQEFFMNPRRFAGAVLLVGSVALSSPSFAQAQAAGILAPAAATGAVTTAVVTVATFVAATVIINTSGTTGTR
jgi:hypothetical protein